MTTHSFISSTPPWWATAEIDAISLAMQDMYYSATSWVTQISDYGYADEHVLPLTKLLAEMSMFVGFVQGLEFDAFPLGHCPVADSKAQFMRIKAVWADNDFANLHLRFTLEALDAQKKENLEIEVLYRECFGEKGQ